MNLFKKMLFAMVMVALVGAIQTADAGNVTGTIKFEGTPPKSKKMDMSADPACKHGHSKPVLSEVLVLGPGQSIANIMVRVKTGLPAGKKYKAPAKPVVLNQKGCMYEPHVLGMMAGQPLKILNSDKTLHNVHAMPKVNREFNIAMPQTVKEKTKKFRKAEFMFPIKCDVHPWMRTWVGVMDHPFFNVTGKDGKFMIKDLPAGTYEIEAWHEKMGSQVAKVTVPASGEVTQDFKFSRGSKTASN